jgi:hypothetical protein
VAVILTEIFEIWKYAETGRDDIMGSWKNVTSAISRMSSASVARNEVMYASWIWGNYIVLSASLSQGESTQNSENHCYFHGRTGSLLPIDRSSESTSGVLQSVIPHIPCAVFI